MAKPFSMNYKTYTGPAGTPKDWRAAFNATMGTEEARDAMGADTPEAILGISVGAVWSTVVSAYRAGVLATHPDRCLFHGLSIETATQKFRQVLAAYTLLKSRYGQ